MKIYTKTGDSGTTSLLSGDRVQKFNLRVDTYGTFDELNSWVGYVRSLNEDSEVEAILEHLQPKLHILCSDVASPTSTETRGPRISERDEKWLEEGIDRLTTDLPELKNFILPGGSPTGAALHVARTVCRRGERLLVKLAAEEGNVNPAAPRFANRLSDFLYTLARWTNHRASAVEKNWVGKEYME